jgi:UDP-3-O-[3-hydroxymyristoyl] glucosamine N-acyltransferase
MAVASFFPVRPSVTLADLCSALGVALGDTAHAARLIHGVDTLYRAKSGDLTFAILPKLADDVAALRDVAVVCTPALAAKLHASCSAIVHSSPALLFNRFARHLYPDAAKPADFGMHDEPQAALHALAAQSLSFIHPTARIERGARISPGVTIAAHVEIGAGSFIAPGVRIAANCKIGRNVQIGMNAAVQCALIGDNVVIGPGCSIGHDGFGYVPGPEGLEKVPQLGRVIIQSNVDIGANSCVDRGSLGDTVIGEGTKIDNLVQVAHNVKIGRNCVVAAQTGFSGSVTLGDFVMVGGQVGIADHMNIGKGAKIGAQSGVIGHLAEGKQYAGMPARPAREFFREAAVLKALAKQRRSDAGGKNDQTERDDGGE